MKDQQKERNQDRVQYTKNEKEGVKQQLALTRYDKYDCRVATDEDSNRARKAHGQRLENYGIKTKIRRGPVINFGPKVLVRVTTPHTDALVIQATIANYEVARVFVDTRSFVNIIFKDVFDQMQVNLTKLHYTSTALLGFTSHQVQPLE